jgi:probable DNA metabolism protein
VTDKPIPVNDPAVYIYDGTFDGFLTVVFDAYASKRQPLQIVKEHRRRPNFFDVEIYVAADAEKSERVWKGIVARSDVPVSQMFCLAFASDLPDVEIEMYRWLKKLFADTTGIFFKNLLDETAFALYGIARKVKREINRFYGFVRFRETSNGMYFAVIEPDHDIVTLLGPHFAARYPAQAWVIYDRRRDKGIYYDKPTLNEITLTDKQFDTMTGDLNRDMKAENEDSYRKLWKAYYDAINITERKNTRLMLRCLPRRYWKYLPEKQ